MPNDAGAVLKMDMAKADAGFLQSLYQAVEGILLGVGIVKRFRTQLIRHRKMREDAFKGEILQLADR